MKSLEINQFEEFYRFLLEYFPYDEVKEYHHYYDLLKRSILNVEYEYDNGFQYIISYFELENMVFIDYYAICKNNQGKGIGTKVLTSFIKKFNKPVYLEVELPDDEIKQRRIRFYQNIGFKLNQYEYIVPKKVSCTTDLNFYIMSYPQKIDKDKFQVLYKQIIEEVYQYKGVNYEEENI
jgi:hypothetical protein